MKQTAQPSTRPDGSANDGAGPCGRFEIEPGVSHGTSSLNCSLLVVGKGRVATQNHTGANLGRSVLPRMVWNTVLPRARCSSRSELCSFPAPVIPVITKESAPRPSAGHAAMLAMSMRQGQQRPPASPQCVSPDIASHPHSCDIPEASEHPRLPMRVECALTPLHSVTRPIAGHAAMLAMSMH